MRDGSLPALQTARQIEGPEHSESDVWEDLAVPLDRKNALFQDVALEVVACESEMFTASDISELIGPHVEKNAGRVKKNIELLQELGVVEKVEETRASTYGGRPAALFRRTTKVDEFIAQNPAIERSVRIRAIAKALDTDDIEAMKYLINLGERALQARGLM